MALKIPYASTLAVQDAITAALLEGGELRLYSNNHAPANGDDVSDYTECTFPGYAAITLNGWSAAALNASNQAETELPTQTFTAGTIITPQNVYGIFVVDTGGALVYAELNPAGVVSMAVSGQFYAYLPRFTYQSLN